jgi:hypothetical protein
MHDKNNLENNKAAGAAEVSFKELILKVEGWFGYLRSKWRVILICAIIGSVIGCTYALITKPVYLATSTFVLEDTDDLSGLGQYAGIAAMVGLDLSGHNSGGIFKGDNIMELYKSNAMIEKTLLSQVTFDGKKQPLINRYIDFNKLRNKWADDPVLRQLDFGQYGTDSSSPQVSRLQDSILSTAVARMNDKYFTIAKLKNSLNIYRAEVKAPDEFFAKSFNEEIVRNVNDFYIHTKMSRSLLTVRLLQQKIDSIRTSMSAVKPSGFALETNTEVLGELIKNLELSKINLQKEMPLIQLIDRPKFPLERFDVTITEGILYGFFGFGFLSMLILWFRRLYTELVYRID